MDTRGRAGLLASSPRLLARSLTPRVIGLQGIREAQPHCTGNRGSDVCPEVTGRLPSLGPQSRGCSLGRRSCPHCQWRPPGMVSGLSAALSWWPKQMPGVASREILHRKEEARVPRGADLGGGGLLGGDRWATGSGGGGRLSRVLTQHSALCACGPVSCWSSDSCF